MNDISAWRIEWWRLVRTRRLLALLAVFVIIGFAEPLTARYLAQLVNSAGSAQRIKVTVPAPVPADGISSYTNNAMLIGLIVSVVIAAHACTVDANPALSIFYRTRGRNFAALLLPRAATTTTAVVGAYLIGLLVAWYETTVLIGAPDVTPMLFSGVLGAVYLAFGVAVTALAATVTRSTSATAGITLVIMLLCPILGRLPAVSSWLPSALVSAPTELLHHTAVDHYPRALAMSIALPAGSLVLAAIHGNHREVS